MKKITRCALGLAILFSSCTKEPNWVRNYCQPVNTSNPTDIQRGSNINWSEGMTDAECIKIIKGLTRMIRVNQYSYHQYCTI